jgi:putative SOS response-associated peptidase YedK
MPTFQDDVMCGRYTLTAPAELASALASVGVEAAAPGLVPRYNVAPTQAAPVVANRADRRIELFRWGLVPHWADSLGIGSRLLNARAETVATRPAFRDALARRRCLVPADGFFEWRRPRRGPPQPYWIRREPRAVFCFAGLWDRWRPKDPEASGGWIESFTIVTTGADPVVGAIHDRMPVILDPADWERWLTPEPVPAEAFADLLAPTASPPGAGLITVPVSNVVNSPLRDGPECLAPPAQPVLL